MGRAASAQAAPSAAPPAGPPSRVPRAAQPAMTIPAFALAYLSVLVDALFFGSRFAFFHLPISLAFILFLLLALGSWTNEEMRRDETMTDRRV